MDIERKKAEIEKGLSACPFGTSHNLDWKPELWGEQHGMEGHADGKVTHRYCVSCECGANGPWVQGVSEEEVMIAAADDWNKRTI